MTEPSVDEAVSSVEQYFSYFTKALQSGLADLAVAWFDTPEILAGLVANGTMFDAKLGIDQSTFNVSQKIQEIAFANALPMTWGT